MKPALFSLCCFLIAMQAGAQTFKKYPVSNSGCSIRNYCLAKFDKTLSEDSSTVYTGECVNDGITYGVICIKLLREVENLVMAEDLMVAYLDFLKLNFDITKSAGYSKGHLLNDDGDTRGIMDYWEEGDGNKWKVKCWTDGRFIGFLFAHGKKELPEEKVNTFLDSFLLPDRP